MKPKDRTSPEPEQSRLGPKVDKPKREHRYRAEVRLAGFGSAGSHWTGSSFGRRHDADAHMARLMRKWPGIGVEARVVDTWEGKVLMAARRPDRHKPWVVSQPKTP